ncbi:BnaA10g29360D [Brassica napus]|uniref:Ubiquitin carboxyl-terminal hydrolase n=1 Tax=Brassica napus TaxID=3708 RepID=A0A078IUF2_BRANA|nr:BnaA10g29360D [Brassica napus]
MEIQTDQDGSCAAVSSSSASAVFRKIEFHLARKPFNGFSSRGSDFKMETLNPSSSSNNRAFSSPSVKKVDGPDSLDRELTFTKTIRKIGAGLENLGNTCYLNSVLQCLTYTEPLAAYLQDVAHEQRCRVAGFCALCAMQRHVRTALQSTGRSVAPKYLVSNLRCVSQNFRKCRQEDAHEYMINLLECMHKCCLASGVPSESSDAYRSSLVHKIFGGSLRSQVKCTQCSHCSDKFDPFLDLSLDISRADSLQRALLRFTAVELLDNGSKVYQCERCKQKVKAVKQLTVFKAPSVLTVHLKRFEAYRSEKIDKKVEFPPAIDMKPFVSGPYEGNLKYTLYGVLVHCGGSIHSGHYYCFVRTSSGMWYSLDDNEVIQASEKTVFNQKAYMLFYVRDRQNTAPKNPVTVAKKETSKESVAVNRTSLIVSSNRNDQVNGSTVIKACSLNATVANGTAPLRACDKGSPACLTPKDVNAKDPPSSVEGKEILEGQNGTAPVKSKNLERPCDVGAPVVLTQKDLINNNKTLQKEESLPQANGEGSLVKEDSKAACTMMPGKASPLLDDSTNTQILVNLPTSLGKAENSVDEKKSANNLNESDTSLKVSVKNDNSPMEEAVLDNQTLVHQSDESATESIKQTSVEETFTTPRKTRKRNKKTVQVGLSSFKLALGVRKKRGRSRTLAVKGTSDVSVDNETIMTSNGNMLLASPILELKERTNQNGAVLASDQHQPLRSSDLSEASQNAKRKRDNSKEEQILSQKEQVTILTRGLPETVVAKWDEEVSAFKMGSSESTRIGYVADEWDEEYDRGKKKKIRIKEEMYVGPNPFQAFASKKQQTDTKKKWTQGRNTAKTGFRI